MKTISLKQVVALVLALVMVGSLLTGCGNQVKATTDNQLDIGVRYLSELDYENAIAAFNAAIEVNGKDANAYAGLYAAYIAMGMPEMAAQIFEKAVSAGVDEAQMIGSVMGMADTVQEGYDKANPEGTESPAKDINLSVAEQALKDGLYDEAIEAFNRVLDQEPDNEQAHSGIYVSNLAKGDEDAAEEALERAKEQGLDPEEMKDHIDYYKEVAGLTDDGASEEPAEEENSETEEEKPEEELEKKGFISKVIEVVKEIIAPAPENGGNSSSNDKNDEGGSESSSSGSSNPYPASPSNPYVPPVTPGNPTLPEGSHIDMPENNVIPDNPNIPESISVSHTVIAPPVAVPNYLDKSTMYAVPYMKSEWVNDPETGLGKNIAYRYDGSVYEWTEYAEDASTVTYNGQGQVISSSVRDGNKTYFYDANGNPTHADEGFYDENGRYIGRKLYDSYGDLYEQTTYAKYSNGYNERNVTRDAAGNVKRIEMYDSNGNLTCIERYYDIEPYGIQVRDDYVAKISYSYDVNGNLVSSNPFISTEHSGKPSEDLGNGWTRSYGTDGNGNIVYTYDEGYDENGYQFGIRYNGEDLSDINGYYYHIGGENTSDSCYVDYDKDGNVGYSYQHKYDLLGRPILNVRYDGQGNEEYREETVYGQGKSKTVKYYSNGSLVQTDVYDEEGNLVSNGGSTFSLMSLALLEEESTLSEERLQISSEASEQASTNQTIEETSEENTGKIIDETPVEEIVEDTIEEVLVEESVEEPSEEVIEEIIEEASVEEAVKEVVEAPTNEAV